MTARQVALLALAAAAVFALMVVGPEQAASQTTTTGSTSSTVPTIEVPPTSAGSPTSPPSTVSSSVPSSTPSSTVSPSTEQATTSTAPSTTSSTTSSSTSSTSTSEADGAAGGELGDEDEQIQILGVNEVDGDDGEPGEVILDIAVPPAIGPLPVTGQNFAVLDGGQLVDPMVAPTGSAAEIVLVLDTSGSMRGSALAAAKEAAGAFVAALPADAKVGLISFDETVVIHQEPTVDRDAVLADLEQLEATGAETALWDALLVGAEALAGSDDGRASIVVLSDGDDTISDAEPGEVVDRFDSGSVALYAVAIESSDTDLVALEQVAAGIGGQFLATSDIGQLDSLYTDIAGRLANRYRVWFAPVGSGERTVVVSVATDRGVASARTLVGTGTSVAGPTISEPTTGAEPAPILNLDEEQTLGLVVAPSAGGLSSPGLLWVGLGSMFAAMLVGGALLVRPGNQVRLDAAASADRITGLNLRAGRVIDRVLASHDRGKRIDRRLEAADVNLRPGEFVLAMFVVVVAVAVLVGVLAGAAQAAIVVAVIVIGASILLGVRARKRQNRFADQLTETLGIMASSLRAGQSLPKAIELVGAEAPSPTAEQFHRIAFEVRVGRDLTDSIRDTAERMASPDLEWVAQAIDINREYGGDLTEILDNVAGTIRERRTVARQVDALSAESRATGWLLMALPVVIFLFSWWRTPDTIAGFVGDPIGRILLVGAITGMAVGHLWIRQLVKVKY